MTLPLAILHVLVAARRAITVPLIAAEVPHFTGKAETDADINATLSQLSRMAPPMAKGTDTGLRGTVWTFTPDGKLEVLG
jgi:hypothetical protein